MSAEQWEGLCDDWLGAIGPFEEMAVYQPRQASRIGLGLLLIGHRRPVTFVKARPENSKLENERRALIAVSASRPTSFSAAVPLAHGRHLGWEWLALSSLPPRLHRPPRRPPVEAIVEDVRAALRPALDPAGVAGTWQPMHGDLTPWNLRQFDRAGLWLTDWEDASWGPPGADEAYYRATAAALSLSPVERSPYQEAVSFWQEKLRNRTTTGTGELNLAILEALDSMAR
ncbi:MAG: aminoglycoside phosphotransferase family protein [Actinomycetota bacterium]|nr:aminoglycoside phosphotransferase family protein [Actinomycetota bacterium]